MTRAVIYARYSSDNQRDASIEDQIRQCRARIQQEGWQLEAVYSDHAISGATALRPGYQKMLEDARASRFEILVAEALDRLSRDQENIAGLFKQLSFAGVRLITLSEGRGRRTACRPQGHHECPLPQGPRAENPARPRRARAPGQVWRGALLRL